MVKYSTKEKGLLATLKKIRYSSQPSLNTISTFIDEYAPILNKIESFEEYPSQKAILLAHFKAEFESSGNSIQYVLPKDFVINSVQLFKAIRLVCTRMTAMLKKKQVFRVDADYWSSEGFDIYVIYILQENARLGNKLKIKPNNKDIRDIAAIYIDKERNCIKTINIPTKLKKLFEMLLQTEIGVPLVTPEIPIAASWKDASLNIVNPGEDLELEEISFTKSEFFTGEGITIKSPKGTANRYLEALLNQKSPELLDPKDFDLAHFDYIRVRRRGGKTNYFKFRVTDAGALILENKSKYKDILLERKLEKSGVPIGKPIFDTRKIPKEKIFQEIIIRGFVSKGEMKLGVVKEVLSELEGYGVIKEKKPMRSYRCHKSMKCYQGSAFRTQRCPVCGGRNRTSWWENGEEIIFNFDTILSRLKYLMRKSGIRYKRSKRTFYDNRYELHKLRIPDSREINLYLNKDGLYKHVLRDFSLCPRPLVCINFRGEIKKSPEFLYQEDASSFLIKLFDSNDQTFPDFIKDLAVNPSFSEAIENSFKDSLAELRKIKNKNEFPTKGKGRKYEHLVYNVFNYIFPISDKWGGKNLPDGIIGIQSDDTTDFVFWDAKRYDQTKLSEYASKRKKGVIKDLEYALQSLKQEHLYTSGRLEYYLFVTSNTTKEDFERVQEKIAKIITRNRYLEIPGRKRRKRNPMYARLKEVKFCCINIDELIVLASYFEDKSKRDRLLRNPQFGKAMKIILLGEHGYCGKTRIKQELDKLLSEKEFIPDKKDHARSGGELVE